MEAQEINSTYWLARLQHIFKEISLFCQTSLRNAVDVELVLEADGFNREELEIMLDLGIKRLRVTEKDFKEVAKLDRGKLHFNGDVQVFDWANFRRIDLWENLMSLEQAEKVNEYLIKNGIILKVLLAIDFDNQRNGFESKQLFLQMKELAKFKNLKIQGISALGEITEEKMHKMRSLFDLLRQKYKGIENLEMGGMKSLKMAIGYGAHLVTLKKDDLF
ncbi:MAG: alanine racemase [Candidatus Altimarinota bacterium]